MEQEKQTNGVRPPGPRPTIQQKQCASDGNRNTSCTQNTWHLGSNPRKRTNAYGYDGNWHTWRI